MFSIFFIVVTNALTPTIPKGKIRDAASRRIVYIVDMFGDAAVKVTPEGRVEFIQKRGFVKPSEPCVWQGNLYISNYGGTTVAEIPLK